MTKQPTEDIKVTPLMAQYFKLKSKNPDAILLYRVGDFYETFGSDAVKVSQTLGIVLTKRNNGGADIELAGFPYHSLDIYLPKLVKSGFRVAICEQLEKPSKEKKIVDRGITDVITPGVTIDDSLLSGKSNNYLASIHFTAKGVHGISFLDISTGDFLLSEGQDDSILKLVESFNPSEIIYSKSYQHKCDKLFGDRFYTYPLEEWIYTFDFARDQLLNTFNLSNLKGFGVEDYEQGQTAAGAALHYLLSTKNDKLKHLSTIQRIHSDHFVWLDKFTIRNLELIQSVHPSGKSLLDIMDQTSSPMGARMMRMWIVMPLLNPQKINARFDSIEELLQNDLTTLKLDDHIRQIGDLERIVSKLSMEKISPRELAQLKKALNNHEFIKSTCQSFNSSPLKILGDKINLCSQAKIEIERAIVEDPPVNLTKGDVFCPGYNEELDDLKNTIKNSKTLLLEVQRKEVARTGITSLKIGFNNVFGYYLEVTNKYKDQDLIPDDWVRKQTLANAERYVTDELKKLEDKILTAEEKIQVIEERLFAELIQILIEYIHPLQQNARLIAELDCLLSFAKIASKFNYCKPIIDDSFDIDLKAGRHPVIEQQLPIDTEYIANDLQLSNQDTQIMMITGPNMSGKSAVLRQTALIVLMAQMGSYVPAREARIGIVDKIFTRVGASDNISSGESTFMLEMNETASIMNNISSRSLILLDEIGRGTATYDGISIAWSLAEYLHNNTKFNPKTLFATHYHELNELAQSYGRIRNYHISTKEVGNKVHFLRKLTPGGSEHSFGIHVAAMAGMPKQIIERASQILHELEKKTIATQGGVSVKKPHTQVIQSQPIQMSIFETFDPLAGQLKDEIQKIEINSLTPIECMLKLHELKKLLD